VDGGRGEGMGSRMLSEGISNELGKYLSTSLRMYLTQVFTFGFLMAVSNTVELGQRLASEPRGVGIAVAFRACMRVFEIFMIVDARTAAAEKSCLIAVRAVLTSGVSAVTRNPEIQMAALRVAHTALVRAAYPLEPLAQSASGEKSRSLTSILKAQDAAASIAVYAFTGEEEAVRNMRTIVNRSVFSDINLDNDPVSIISAENSIPRALRLAMVNLGAGKFNVLRSGGPWTFWAEWYDRAMAGDPLPWDLQEQIALIPDEIWEAGPEAVAEEIKRIQLEYVARALPQASGIRFDEEAAVFRKVVPEVARPQLLGATLAQVEGALEDVLADPSNGLHVRSREVQVLSRMLERFGNDPQRIEMDCTSVYGSLTRQLTSEELPPSEQNLALRDAVSEVAEGIRATDPEIAENRRILSEVKLRDMSGEAVAAFEEALPVLETVSDDELGAEFRENVLELTEKMRMPVLGEEPRNPGIRAAYDEEIRLFKRIADMAIVMRSNEVLDRIEKKHSITRGDIVGILVSLALFAVSQF